MSELSHRIASRIVGKESEDVEQIIEEELTLEQESRLQMMRRKIHSLWSSIEYLINERDSKPETVQAKHAWDMILKHISRELLDVKEML
jgi:hypothetical protein